MEICSTIDSIMMGKDRWRWWVEYVAHVHSAGFTHTDLSQMTVNSQCLVSWSPVNNNAGANFSWHLCIILKYCRVLMQETWFSCLFTFGHIVVIQFYCQYKVCEKDPEHIKMCSQPNGETISTLNNLQCLQTLAAHRFLNLECLVNLPCPWLIVICIFSLCPCSCQGGQR